MAELSLGRSTRKGVLGAFSQALGKGFGQIVGILLTLTILIASSYYVIVIANVLYTSYFSIAGGFSESRFDLYQSQLGNGWIQYGIAVGTIAIGSWVIHKGLKNGIEVVSKIFVPFFLVAICYLIYQAFQLEGARSQFVAFLKPDFGALKMEYIFAALGQSFYSLSLGGTFMVVYGGYLKDENPIPRTSFFTSLGDIGAALLASLFIVPAILVFGLDMTSGPQLIFNTLPQLFDTMANGRFMGSLFLVALSMVAFLSLIATYEVLLGSIQDIPWLSWKRGTIILLIAITEAVLCFPSAFDANLIGLLDLIFGSGMQVLGSGLAVIGLVWGLGKTTALSQLFKGSNPGFHQAFYFWLKWVIPLVLLTVLVGYLINVL